MANFAELFPPYLGDQPFLYFCFSNSDAGRLRPLFQRLYERGFRIWYPIGNASTVAERKERDTRMLKARLVVLYQTKATRMDHTAKSAVLVCQEKNIPIISIDTDDAESKLSMGLDSRAIHIQAHGTDALEMALLRADGFSQELIGPANAIQNNRLFRFAYIIFAVAILLIGAAFLFRQMRKPSIVQTTDTVFFSDEYLTAAVREALGGGPITEDSLRTVTTLSLTVLPNNTDAFALLPNLSRIELDQASANEASALLEQYEIVLKGGAQ